MVQDAVVLSVIVNSDSALLNELVPALFNGFTYEAVPSVGDSGSVITRE